MAGKYNSHTGVLSQIPSDETRRFSKIPIWSLSFYYKAQIVSITFNDSFTFNMDMSHSRMTLELFTFEIWKRRS